MSKLLLLYIKNVAFSLILQADLGKRRFPCDAEPVGVCTAKIKRWPTVHGDSFETSIDEIGGITNDRLLNQQVLIALVRVLWNTGPLGIGCTNHLVINQKLHIPREVWALLECMGFHVCKCHGSTLILAKDVKWCLGERLGTEDTATTEEDDEVEEGDDEEDDEVEEGDDEEDDEVEEGDEEEHDEVEEGDEEDRDLEEGGIPS